MTRTDRALLRLSASACGFLLAFPAVVQAQPYPSKPVRMIVISAPPAVPICWRARSGAR
jgi:hypothetical protein